MSKSSCKIKSSCRHNYRLDKVRTLLKEKLKGLALRLRDPLQLSGRADDGLCVARTCQVGLEHSHLVDYEGG